MQCIEWASCGGEGSADGRLFLFFILIEMLAVVVLYVNGLDDGTEIVIRCWERFSVFIYTTELPFVVSTITWSTMLS